MSPDFLIREITAADDPAICQIIQQVGAEFGAIGQGFGPSDPEVLAMSQAFLPEPDACYFVAQVGNVLVGGGGIAPLRNHLGICELKKLFILPQGRGFGIGNALMQKCLSFAESQAFEACYLDTIASMDTAIHLYIKYGFEYLPAPLDAESHSGCDVWMMKRFKPSHVISNKSTVNQ